MSAHRMVVIAAALTTMVAAMLASALAVLSGQAVPLAAHKDLAAADTTLTITGSLSASQDAQYRAQLSAQIATALHGAPYRLYHAAWSHPLGFVTGGPTTGVAKGNTPILTAAALDDVRAHAVLVTGGWPASTAPVVQAALPVTAAALLHLAPGDTVKLRDRISGKPSTFKITGLYRPAQLSGVASRYWHLDTTGLAGFTISGGFVTYGPLTVPAADFGQPASGPELATGAASWVAQPATDLIPAGQAAPISADLRGLQQTLGTAGTLPSLLLTTDLPTLLSNIAAAENVARALLAMCAIILALLAGAALLAVARLLAGQREGETAMLAARGATRGQVVRLAAAEALPLCLVAAVAGGAGGIWLARVLAPTAPTRVTADTVQATAALAAGALVIMLVPVLSRLTPGAAWARRGRQAAISTASRAGADLALIALAVLACWQLRHYSVVSAGASGTFGVDPVVAAAPALALAAGTVTALRLLPIAGRGFDRLAAHGRRLVTALASWQISRQPIRQGGAALLIVLAVATATLALTQRTSWHQSGRDQAAFAAGSDVRVRPAQAVTPGQAGALVSLPGVRRAMPVADFGYALETSDVLAVNARDAAAIVPLRPDQLPMPEARLFDRIRVTPAAGLAIPGRPTSLTVTATLGPAALGIGDVPLSLTIEDADNNMYLLPGSTLPADGHQHTLSFPVTDRTAIYPLRVAGMLLVYQLPAGRVRTPAMLSIHDISGVAGQGLSRLFVTNTSPEIDGVISSASFNGTGNGMSSPYAMPGAPDARPGQPEGTYDITFKTGFGTTGANQVPPDEPVHGQLALVAQPRNNVLPAIATRSFLSGHNLKLGADVTLSLAGTQVTANLVAAVTDFPTASPNGTLIVDLAAVQDILNSSGAGPAPSPQWWLATASGQVPPGIAGTLPDGSTVVSRVAIEQTLLTDPLSTVPQQALLGIGIAALALASTGFCVSIAAGVRQRRAENALLAALGVAPRAAAGQLCLEKFMLSLPSAIAGLAIGAILSRLLVPAITLSATGTAPDPPALIEFGWAPTIAAAIVLAVLPVLVAALVMVRRPDAAAALRAAEAA